MSITLKKLTSVQANPVYDILSSGRRVLSDLPSQEKDGLCRIVREAKAPTAGLRTLMASADIPLHVIAKR